MTVPRPRVLIAHGWLGHAIQFRGLARRVTESLSVPTIGIGAGPDCDGQVIVTPDLLGLYQGHKPKFVRQYATLGETIRGAVSAYVADVREGRYPNESESFH